MASADSLENVGYYFLKAGENDQARPLLTRALKVDPDKGAPLLVEAEKRLGKGSAHSRNFYWILIDMCCRPVPAAYGYRSVSPH